MAQHEPATPLLIGFVLALAVHLAGAFGYAVLHHQISQPDVPPARPDLQITTLEISPERQLHQPTDITIVIANSGEASAEHVGVELSANGEPVQELAFPKPVAPGQTMQVTLPFTATEPGVYQFIAQVDRVEQVAESDETNNHRRADAVWLAPDSPSQAGVADLAIFDLAVEEPRVAQLPVKSVARIANLGQGRSKPTTLVLQIDGQPVGDPIDVPVLEPGSVFEHAQDLVVETPGDHELRLGPASTPDFGDADPTNDHFADTFHWLKHDPLRPGQNAPSTVRMNWISEDDYQQLIARRSRFDQATAQQDVDPTETEDTPVDPTPPAPAPAVAQMTAPAAQPAPEPARPEKMLQEPVNPEQPRQPQPPQPDLPPNDKLTQAPLMRDFPADKAAAPMQGLAEKPTHVEANGVPDPVVPPQPIVDTTAAMEPEAAPPAQAEPAPEMAIATPNVDTAPGPDPLLPPIIEKDSDLPKPALRAPKIKPDPTATPTDATMAAEGPVSTSPVIAKLPIPPDMASKTGSPQPPIEPEEPDAPITQVPVKPLDPMQRNTDGDSEQASEKAGSPDRQPQPMQPPGTPSNPTPAPKQPREAPPVSRIEGEVKPGSVLARYGVEIRTIRPRFSAIALHSSFPVNPVVEVTFNKSGKVTEARIIKTSGYANVDGPILTSLYRWTATGKNLKKLSGDLTVEIRMLLNGTAD